ncbi:peroxiredoxin [Candidatus Uhrbacteria bacterium]|jgi:peroxiredoxin 2/4|nr:peroxiredoxin [Candidatus Uhrbacteria bacterium]
MITIGKEAPDFSDIVAYQSGDFTKVSLSDYKSKWTVLFFYPRDFTFICPTELREFAKHQEDFAKLGCEIVAASTDSEWSHKAWFEKDLPEVKYPVLADTTHQLAKEYQVYNEEEGLAERGLFVIDDEGVVRYALVSAGSVGRSVKETLRVITALQSGELCPVEWAPGSDTLGKA